MVQITVFEFILILFVLGGISASVIILSLLVQKELVRIEANLPEKIVPTLPEPATNADCQHPQLRFGGREEVAGKYRTIGVCQTCGKAYSIEET